MTEAPSTAPPGGGPASAPRPADVYGDVMAAARELYKKIAPALGEDPAKPVESAASAPGSLTLPWDPVRKIIGLLSGGDQEILALADRSASDHFLFSHVVNVTIVALRLGLALDLRGAELETLGLSAFLHDLGLIAHMEITAKPTKLSPEETQRLRGHVQEGQKLLDLFGGWTEELKATVSRVIGESHEREEGQGYPAQLSADRIHLFAKVIAMADVYEAMTHMRPWRPRTVPHDVLRSFVEENAAEFDPTLIRAMIDTFSLYPPGSFVRLSTGEIGRVLTTSPGLPLRPRVWVMIDEKGGRVDGQRVVNLGTKPGTFITEAVDETKIKTTDQRLALALRAQRWWVRGL